MIIKIEEDMLFESLDGTRQPLPAGQWFAQYDAILKDGVIYSSGYAPKVTTSEDEAREWHRA